MNIVLLKNYNNYFDRIIKQEKTLADYLQAVEEYEIVENVNFYDMDGVNAEHVFNFKRNFVPNYMLVIDEMNNILSKWFILEWQKIRGKQYRAILRGDVIANHFNTVLKSPCFVEKAMLRKTSPFIFNKENMTFNQIKSKEYSLKDKTGISWLVGYYAQNKEPTTPVEAKFSFIEGNNFGIPIDTIDKRLNINFDDSSNISWGNFKFDFTFWDRKGTNESVKKNVASYSCNYENKNCKMRTNSIYSINGYYDQNFASLRQLFHNAEDIPNYENKLINGLSSQIIIDTFIEQLKKENLSSFNNSISDDYINSLNNKIVEKDKNYYVLKIEKYEYGNKFEKVLRESSEFGKKLTTIFKSNSEFKQVYWGTNPYTDERGSYSITSNAYVIRAISINAEKESLQVKIPNSRNHCNDAPFDMFCIPFDLTGKKTHNVATEKSTFKIINELSLAMARGLATESGGLGNEKTYLYDVQLLPFCPIEEVREAFNESFNGYNVRNINGFIENEDYSIINKKEGETLKPVSIMFWATKTSGTINIPFNYDVENLPDVNFKINSETTFLRLCSPNFNGIFEFNPYKNNGVKYFNVDYTYKPFNPYIHINPNFSGLYGKDFNDCRGLIIGGDFSIATINDEWARYELNNKNYQQMFDREIKNMDVNYENQLLKNSITTGYHAITGGVAGAIGGFMSGGPIGAGVGAIAGAGGTAISGMSNMYFDKLKYNEAKDFKIDMFGYTLGNIQALPQGLAKTTAFTFNNKIYPVVEEYTCTDREKEALRQKIIYEGMTVMAIGTMQEYISGKGEFFKGKIIRLNDLDDDYHVANEIYQEIAKGVYIYASR